MTEALHHIAYTIRRFKTSTVLNTIELVAAFVVCYLLLTQVMFQAGYNHGINDHERIYRLESTVFETPSQKWGSGTCRFMAEALASMPQVEGVTMIKYAWTPVMTKFKQGDKEVDYPCLICNNTGVSNLTDQVVDGSLEWSDGDRDGVIIPASIAKSYFGTTHAAGKTMLQFTGDSTLAVMVRGVFKDFPENSTPRNYIMRNIGDLYADTPGNWGFTTLVKLKPDVADASSLVEPMVERFRASARRMLAGKDDLELQFLETGLKNIQFQFRPLYDTYFSYADKNDLGNRRALGIIELIVLLMIVIATINTLNFTLAMSPMQVRDTNTRIVLGATRPAIRLRLVIETVITTTLACLLALAFCQMLSMTHVPDELFDGDIALGANPVVVAVLLVIAVVVGVISGVYPAYLVTSFPTATALKSSFGLTPQGVKLRTLLIGLQLVITMFLVSFVCTLYQQTRYIFNSDYGFDIGQILNVELKPQSRDYREALRADLMREPEVEDVAYSRFVIGSIDYYLSSTITNAKDTTKHTRFSLFQVDEHYFPTMGIRMVKGHDFMADDRPDEYWIVNETMNELLVTGEVREFEIPRYGVCENIRYGTTRTDKNTPIAFVCQPGDSTLWKANVRVAADADRDAVKRMIAHLVKKHSGHEAAQVTDMVARLSQSYNNEFRFVRLVFLFSVACIVIMLAGVFCLTMLETEYRRKEIGIRKVAGATSGDIIRMLCLRYCGLILACFVIAVPIAYYISNLWLDSFAEHQPIQWWPFLFSLLVVGGLTLGTILLQCWRTVHENPSSSIRTE